MACLSFTYNSVGQVPASRESRAKRPDWSGKGSPVIVANDAQMEKLLQRLNNTDTEGRDVPSKRATSPQDAQASAQSWTVWTSRDALESEVKGELRNLQDLLPSSSEFSSSSHRETRNTFIRLGMLFAVIADFPDEIRWKPSATVASHYFQQLSEKLSGGNAAEFKLAQEGRETLRELLDGGSPFPNVNEPQTPPWPRVVARVPAMQKLDALTETSMNGFLANPREFNKHRREFKQHAEIVGMLAVLLTFEGVEGTDDTDYLALARTFKSEVNELVKSAREGDYEQCRLQLGKVTQSCAKCHESYR